MRLPFKIRNPKLTSKTHKTKLLPKTQTKKLIPPGVWSLFVGSLLLFIVTVFFVIFTSPEPTLFLPVPVNLPVIPFLPRFLEKLPESRDIFLTALGLVVLGWLVRLIPLVWQFCFPNHTAKSSPNTQTQNLISPVLRGILLCSFLFFFVTLLIINWTSTQPTLFADPVNSSDLRSLPGFLKIPEDSWDIWLPTVGVAFLCILLRFIPPTNATRLVIKSVLLLLAVRYFIWRTTATLNFSHWASTAFSLFLYATEVICFVSLFLDTLQSIWSNAEQRSAEADQYSQDVMAGRYLPSVDVFIPTYNEPEHIVRRTVIGCQAMEYPRKTVYILDDTRRPHIRALAEELGCEYITRPDNKHAKAGNLNNALAQTKGELIAAMDADFVPFKNFLTRTVGFFQRSEVALIQTRQDFYNPDYHARNLGIEHLLPNDQALFYGFVQSSRDVGDSVICCGTSYVVRRSNLEAVGGYHTRCLPEDFSTSTLMSTRGYRILYLNETLSMGESTRTYEDFIKQRLRWLQGNLQVYYCGDEIPIWSTLNWVQKSFAFMQLLGCFWSVFRAVFLVTPLVSAYIGISPVVTTLPEILYYFVPFMLLNVAIFGWGAEYYVSFFWSEVFAIILCFPSLQRIGFTLYNPFGKAFVVTRKGIKAETKNYNLHHTWPLLVLIGLTVAVICLHLLRYCLNLEQPASYAKSGLMIFWLSYNAVLMSIAVLSAIDQPERRAVDRYPLRTDCKVTIGKRSYWGHTNNLSESGASLTLTTNDFFPESQPVVVEFLEHRFSVEAEVVRSTLKKNYSYVALKFTRITVEQSRLLITLLYSNMNWWKQSKKLGGLDSLLAMLSALLKFKPALTKYDR